MKITIKAMCPGCQTKQGLVIKEPKLFGPVCAQFKCEVCESEVMIKVSKDAAQKKGMVNLRTYAMKPSKLLIQMKKEEAEQNAEQG